MLKIRSLVKPCVLLPIVGFIVTGCGGGGSSSGGAVANSPTPTFPLFPTGLYNGTVTQTFAGRGIVEETNDQGITLEIFGSARGQQQVRIAYVQFSGTSAISRDGGFSIPSGTFPIRVATDANRVVATCNGELLFEGMFTENQTVSGTVTTTTEFTCDSSFYGPLTITGTFEATAGVAKLSLKSLPLTVQANN